MAKFTVRFNATFETEIDCKFNELQDEIADICIPESKRVKYVEDTFELLETIDENMNEIEI